MLSEATLQDFRASLRGQLILPGDPGYEEARKIHNAMIDKHPALIVLGTPGGPISGSVIGNDQILCGNVQSTFYFVTPMKDALVTGVHVKSSLLEKLPSRWIRTPGECDWFSRQTAAVFANTIPMALSNPGIPCES